MADWSEGSMTEIGYTYGYYRHSNPATKYSLVPESAACRGVIGFREPGGGAHASRAGLDLTGKCAS